MSERSSADLNSLITRRHPLYEAMADHWEFLESSYNGGRSWFTKNIFQYHKEGETEFAKRIERAFRFNHTREVVDLTNKYLCRQFPSRRPDVPDSVANFWENADGFGLDMNQFMSNVSLKSSTFGCPWIVVDNSVTEVGENQSKSDENYNIYAYVVKPQDVLDFSWNEEDGALNWILIREKIRKDEDPFDTDGHKECYRYRLWTRTSWHLYLVPENGKDPTEHDSGVHDLGLVPVVRADNVISTDKWVTPALIGDVAYLDRAVANYLSNLDAIIQDQTFSQLAIPANNLLPGDEGYTQMIEMGTKRVFVYDGEGGGGPHYLSPDPRQAQLIITAIQQIINEIYHSVGLAGERTKQDNAKGIDNSSGVAKSKDFERVNGLLIAKAQSLQCIENKIAKIVATYAGEENAFDWSHEVAEYPKSFDVQGLQDEFDIALRLSSINAPETLMSENMKRIAEKMLPAASEEEMKEIESSIEEWVKRIKELREFDKESARNASKPEGNGIEEEAKRDRTSSGKTQSQTKERRENGNR